MRRITTLSVGIDFASLRDQRESSVPPLLMPRSSSSGVVDPVLRLTASLNADSTLFWRAPMIVDVDGQTGSFVFVFCINFYFKKCLY